MRPFRFKNASGVVLTNQGVSSLIGSGNQFACQSQMREMPTLEKEGEGEDVFGNSLLLFFTTLEPYLQQH